MPTFDLTREPWLPCERPDGSIVELGLVHAFHQAHELRALRDGSPLVTAALHRLLLAILHRCLGPPDLARWRELYAAGRFDATVIDHYLTAGRQWFDLFHPERPFYQVPGLKERYPADAAWRLVPERSNWGPGTHLFAHRDGRRPQVLAPSAAARHLVALQAFVPGGLVKKAGEPDSASAGPLNRGAVVLLRGESLFETLLLNLVTYAPEADQPIAGHGRADLPCWERPAPRLGPPRRPEGWLDLLTWQSRRLELVTDGAGAVSGVVLCVGETLDGEGLLDPMVAYKRHPRLGFVPVEFDVERVVWRDLHALVRPLDGDTIAPRALQQVARRELAAVIPRERRLMVDVLGQRGDQAKILLVRGERFPVTPKLLADETCGAAVKAMLELCEEVASALHRALRVVARASLAPGERKADEKKDVTPLVRSLGAEQAYWATLGGAFEAFLGVVTEDEPGACRDFDAALWAAAFTVYRAASAGLGTTAHVLKGAALGEQSLWRARRALTRQPEITEAQA
jgi:CRISPR system Cascade subunit CasA